MKSRKVTFFVTVLLKALTINTTTITITRKGEVGKEVTLKDSTNTIGTDSVDSNGDWTIILSSPLAIGNISYSTSINDVPDISPTASMVNFGGSLQIGQTLTGIYTYADINGDNESVSIFKWYRSDDASGTGKTVISGATKKTYVLVAADAGKFISFEVTPVNNNASGTAVVSDINSTAVTAIKLSIMTLSPD